MYFYIYEMSRHVRLFLWRLFFQLRSW